MLSHKKINLTSLIVDKLSRKHPDNKTDLLIPKYKVSPLSYSEFCINCFSSHS